MPATAQLRCIGCADVPTSPAQDFRCLSCGDLLEFNFVKWPDDPPALKRLWNQRRTLLKPLDQSGVWRFRELLPPISEEHIITIREGSTPLYDLPRCAEIAGIENLKAKHHGMNPTASF